MHVCAFTGASKACVKTMSGTQNQEKTSAVMARIEDLLSCAESFLEKGQEEYWLAQAIAAAQHLAKEVMGVDAPAEIKAIRELLK